MASGLVVTCSFSVPARSGLLVLETPGVVRSQGRTPRSFFLPGEYDRLVGYIFLVTWPAHTTSIWEECNQPTGRVSPLTFFSCRLLCCQAIKTLVCRLQHVEQELHCDVCHRGGDVRYPLLDTPFTRVPDHKMTK